MCVFVLPSYVQSIWHEVIWVPSRKRKIFLGSVNHLWWPRTKGAHLPHHLGQKPDKARKLDCCCWEPMSPSQSVKTTHSAKYSTSFRVQAGILMRHKWRISQVIVAWAHKTIYRLHRVYGLAQANSSSCNDIWLWLREVACLVFSGMWHWGNRAPWSFNKINKPDFTQRRPGFSDNCSFNLGCMPFKPCHSSQSNTLNIYVDDDDEEEEEQDEDEDKTEDEDEDEDDDDDAGWWWWWCNHSNLSAQNSLLDLLDLTVISFISFHLFPLGLDHHIALSHVAARSPALRRLKQRLSANAEGFLAVCTRQ